MIHTNKVAFVGDLHLDTTTPSSRIDDYADTSIAKLYALSNMCLIRGIKLLVFLGDIFNKHDQSNTYINSVLKVFKHFKDSGIYCYAIVGNHDLSYERIDTLDRSPLNILFLSGLMEHLTSEVIETDFYKVGLYGLDYPDPPKNVLEQPDIGVLNILATHRFYNYAFNDPHNLSTEDCMNLGYNIYAMGHDHIQYDIDKTSKFWVVRPGSFMRTSSHKYNLDRNILVDVIEFKGTPEEPQIVSTREPVACKPGVEVFSNSVYQRDSTRSLEDELETLHERISSLLGQMSVKSGGKDVFEVLDSMFIEPEVKQCIETYLNIGGYIRNEQNIN